MPAASGSLAFLGAARFQGYWDANGNNASGSGLDGQKLNGVVSALFKTGDSTNAGGYADATGLTASIGDYWQVTGSGTHNVDGNTSWALNDWCIYSGSAGASGNWIKLAFEDTIASVVVGDIAGSTVFNLTGSSDKQILFITGATDAHVIQSGSDSFVFDYSNNRVGIGTSSPDTLLELSNDASTELSVTSFHNSATQVPKLSLRKARGTSASPAIVQDGDTIGYINFQTNDGADDGFHSAARISAKIDGTPGAGDLPARLHFITSDDGEAPAATANIRMTIKNDGKVGVGTITPDHTLSVTGTLGTSGNLTVSGTAHFAHLTASSLSSSYYGDGTHLSNINATTVTVTDNESTDETNAIIFTAGGDLDGGNIGLESDGDLTYNPSSGLLAAANVTATNITASTKIEVNNDTTSGTSQLGLDVDLSHVSTTSATRAVKGIDIDIDQFGARTGNHTYYGINIDMDDAAISPNAGSDTNNMFGVSATPRLVAATDDGQNNVVAFYGVATGGTNGTSTATGIHAEATGADTSIAVKARSTTLPLKLEYNSSNWSDFIVSSGGELTISSSAGFAGIQTTDPEHTLSVTGTLGVSSNATVSGTVHANHLTASSISSSFYGDGAHLSNVPSVANGANDRIATFSSADALNGEANLTFSSANLLTVVGNITASTNISASAFYGDGTHLTNAGTITALNNQSANRLVTIGSTTTELDGEANLTFDGSTNLLTVGGNITGSQFYGGNIYNKNDADTYIDFEGASNQINLFAGGFVHATFYGPSGGQKYILLNALKEDIDFKVHGDNTSDLLKVDAGLDKVGIATSSPEHILSVTGTLGVSGDTTISGSSYLKNAIVTPGASGGDALAITHTDVDKHAIKVVSTNNTIGIPLLIDHNDDTTAAASTKLSFAIDFDKTGIQAQSTTSSFCAQDITMLDAANNHAGGTVHMTGSTIFVSSSYPGGLNTTNTGLRVLTQGADTNYDALFLGGNVGIGDSTPLTKLSVVANSPGNTAMFVRNDGDDPNRMGVFISCGKDTPGSNGDIVWLVLADGDSNGVSGLVSRIRYDTGGAGAVLESASDRRVKTDIKPTKVNALEILNNIPLSEFKMAKKNKPIGDLNRIGFVAQDCEKAWPEMVSEMEDGDYNHKIKTIAPSTLIPVLVKAIQELSAEVEALKKK